MLGVLKWIGTVTGVVGALIVAMNMPWSGYGFILFTIPSMTWGMVAWKMREHSLLVLQTVFLCINLMGIWRWLM